MRPQDILLPVAAGLYCPPGDFYVDPSGLVPRPDHPRSRRSCPNRPWRSWRRGRRWISSAALWRGFRRRNRRPPRRGVKRGDVPLMFHPAGHVLGSAQIVVERKGPLVVSGDYKRRVIHLPALWVVPCDVFVTEATFGLPVFRHPDPADEVETLPRGAVSGAHAPRRRVFAWQGAAHDRSAARGRIRQDDLYPRRDGKDHALLSDPRHRARRTTRR